MKAEVHSYESFGTVDGPGVRFVVFMQGCPLRCAYCHNPDTWHCGEGKKKDIDEIVQEILKYKAYFKNGGGVTISGGEPLLQIEAVICLLEELKKKGIHTCVDTSGICFQSEDEKVVSQYERLLSVCDLFLLDIKHIDNEKHKELTGLPNQRPLAFAKFLSEHGKPMWIRHVLVPGYTTDKEYLYKLRSFLDTLYTVEKVEVLPYHTMGIVKYKKMNLAYRLQDVQPPTKEQVEEAKFILYGKEV